MTTATTSTVSLSVSRRVAAGAICVFLGAVMVFAAGFSHVSVAHNAAHDTRHAIGFPCH